MFVSKKEKIMYGWPFVMQFHMQIRILNDTSVIMFQRINESVKLVQISIKK